MPGEMPVPGRIVALDRETGAARWTRDAATAWPPVVAGGAVYVATADAIRALDARTGEERWRVPSATPIAGLLVAADLVIGLTAPDLALAVRAAGGERVWQRPLGAASGTPALASDGDRIFVARGSVIAGLRVSDGVVLWSRTLSGQLGQPVAAGDRVIVGSTDRFVWAIDAEDGDIEWTWRTGGAVVGAAAAAQVVYFVSLDNILRAVNRGNGNQRW